ncbi:oxidoreductase yfjR [Cupriavidus basilensis OR16]|uniref:Oxidoreductase yfjR n=1 Tax=Cupriavidus basilensis OR16 TaxID=1127483 RepID=H1S1Y7_9BURK|nr:NAD(P)-dependent oxidoreductase [Cupriavidus basilensis]EHP43481.1 oxidoreductase yfjR [Cupriavidus basilensis OR16]
MKIGFVGLGSMGAAIAMNLIESGHDVHVFNRNPARAEPLRAAGASVATSPAQAALSADVVFTMVSDDAAHAAVTFGEAGIATTLKPGALHISMSTISVATAQDHAAKYREAGLGFVSAPVFGRPDAAAARKLFIMAAGADEYLKVAVPLLELLGQSVGIVGEDYGPLIASQRFQPPGFSLPLGQKDNRLMLAAAEALGVPLPLASLVHDRFLNLRSQGIGAEHDWSAIALCALTDAGLSKQLYGG